jgi:hypothetical protein
MYQKGVYYSGIKIFNGLPETIKDISRKPNKFKIALKHFLLTQSYYGLDEFIFLTNSNNVKFLCTYSLSSVLLLHWFLNFMLLFVYLFSL